MVCVMCNVQGDVMCNVQGDVMCNVQGDVSRYFVVASNVLSSTIGRPIAVPCSVVTINLIGRPIAVPCSVVTINLTAVSHLFQYKTLLAVLTSSQRSAMWLCPPRI